MVEEVAEFFKKILSLPSISQPGKLYEFFIKNKNNLAIILSKEGGLDKFAGLIETLSHGCGANIATQANIALYQALIDDPIDQILFSVYHQRILLPILNYGGDRLGSNLTGINPLNDHALKRNYIAPAGLLKAIREEFQKDGQIITSPMLFISQTQKGKADNYANELTEILCDKYPKTEEFNEVAADLATYIVIKSSMPHLLNNSYLSDFDSKRCEELIKMAQEECRASNIKPNSSGHGFSIVRNTGKIITRG